MTLTFPTDLLGLERNADDIAAERACEELIVAFSDLLDDGDIEGAFAHHADDVEFWEVGATEPTRDRATAIANASRFRFAYPGRRTFHAPSNVLVRRTGPETMEARYSLTVWELTARENDETVQLRVPALFCIAQEHLKFSRGADGAWRIHEHRMFLTAPRREGGPF